MPMVGFETLPKLVRFALVGGIASLTYAVCVLMLSSQFGMHPVVSSVVGYSISLLVGFVGQRSLTFRSRARVKVDIIRFLVAQGLNLLIVSALISASMELRSGNYLWGLMIALIAIPLLNFAMLNWWVFKEQENE
jgi:putative flippase GtrA